MPVTHELWLVALSLVVAIQGAFVGLTLAVQIGVAVGLGKMVLRVLHRHHYGRRGDPPLDTAGREPYITVLSSHR